MKKFYGWVVKHPKLIMSVFFVLFVIALCCMPFISVNYDMNDYLPEDSASTVAIDTMNAEYEGGIPNARVMVQNVTLPEALSYKAKIQAIDGVSDVTWLDDVASVTQPLEFVDTDTLETYYKDGNALYSVTLDDGKEIDACKEIRDVIGDENAMTGSAVSAAVATESTVSEIRIITCFAVIFAFVVLTITTTAWAEPVVVLVGIGVAVVINAGSNLIFGEISFVTNAAGSILQLAVSMDYSVFLLHRFEENRKTITDPKEAMIDALCSSTSSISSSGLTTVIGFLALCLMRFRIGPDLGLALAKGIAISLVSVFVFMPVFILSTYKLIDKTGHRSFLPNFHGFANVVTHIMVPLVILFVILIVPSYLASNANDFYYGSSHIFGTETQLGADTEKIEDAFGLSDTYVLLVPKGDTATEEKLSDALHNLPRIKSILSYVDTVGSEIPESYLDADTLSKLNSEHYTRMVLSVEAAYEGDDTYNLVRTIRNTAQEYYPDQWLLAGEGVSTLDLKDTVTADMVKVNLIAIGAVFVVLLLSMKSISLPVILVLAIETAIWINLSFPYFAGDTIFYISYLIISSIQLGATVDYAILMTDRYMEYRATMLKKEAMKQTIASVTASILTSGSVLTVTGFLLGNVSSHGILAQLGIFLGRGTVCSLVIVLFVLPGLLYLLDGLIAKTTKGHEFIHE